MGNFVWSAFKVLLWTLVALHALVTFLSWILTIRTLGGPDWTNLRRITIHLHRPSEFGNKIAFAPSLFKGKEIARDLRRVTYSDQEEGTISHV
jgi:hypothetical protein